MSEQPEPTSTDSTAGGIEVTQPATTEAAGTDPVVTTPDGSEAEETGVVVTDATTAEAPAVEATGGAGDDAGSLLDQEGDAAADYLEELLDIADLDGDIDIFEENGRASVAVVADGDDQEGLAVLVGRDGAVLDALQELTRLAAQARTGERSRLLLDIGGWREARRGEAAVIATEAIQRAKADSRPVELQPMPAYQRKAVHDAVAAAGMRSESDGVEPSRFVVVHPV